jgi:tryptophan synthase alpha chain
MDRISAAFAHKPIFMPYFPVGFPDMETSVDVLEALAKHGADLIEVGLSFSDPLADGPIIQKATQTALEQGVTTRKAIAVVAELRRRGVEIPLILMGYYNPMLAYGLEAFAQDALDAGADGFIIPDLPAGEAGEFHVALAAAGAPAVPLIQMLAPTTPSERMELLAQAAKGFIYLVSVTGVTGARDQLPEGLAELVAQVRRVSWVPVCVGFGISTPEQARAVAAVADGVIVGSACVRTIGESADPVRAARGFASDFLRALK